MNVPKNEGNYVIVNLHRDDSQLANPLKMNRICVIMRYRAVNSLFSYKNQSDNAV